MTSSAAERYVSPSALATPDLLKQFSAARLATSDEAFPPPAPEPNGSPATTLPASAKPQKNKASTAFQCPNVAPVRICEISTLAKTKAPMRVSSNQHGDLTTAAS